jgi:hypothetical protein
VTVLGAYNFVALSLIISSAEGSINASVGHVVY